MMSLVPEGLRVDDNCNDLADLSQLYHDRDAHLITREISESVRRLEKVCADRMCVSCYKEIPEGRRHALPGVRFCKPCQEKRDSVPSFRKLGERPLNHRPTF